MGKPDIVSVIPDVPITELRPPPPVEKLHDALYEAGQPRATRAATIEKPEGTEDRYLSRQDCDVAICPEPNMRSARPRPSRHDAASQAALCGSSLAHRPSHGCGLRNILRL